MRSEFALAEATIEEALSTLRRICDGDHALAGIALRNLGYLRIDEGRDGEAEAQLEEAQRIQHEWLGQEHPMAARAPVHQAELARRAGTADLRIVRFRSALRDVLGEPRRSPLTSDSRPRPQGTQDGWASPP